MDADKPQPGIDLHWLETVQRVVQYAATVAVVITVVLVVLTSRKLAAVNRALDAQQTRLTEATTELDIKVTRIDVLDGALKELETRFARVSAAMRAIEPAGTSTSSGDPAPQPERPIPARVYVQIFDEAQRPHARDLQRALEAARFVVPGIENVGHSRAPYQARSDVRFYGGATNTSDVGLIRSIASRFDVDLKETPLKPSTGVRPRHYEVWLGRDFR